MAKAALNMLTRTAAADYQADGIQMNSVDNGVGDGRGRGGDRGAEGGLQECLEAEKPSSPNCWGSKAVLVMQATP